MAPFWFDCTLLTLAWLGKLFSGMINQKLTTEERQFSGKGMICLESIWSAKQDKKVNNFFWESIPTTDLLSREGIRSLESLDLRDLLVLRGTQRNRNLEQNILILNWDGYKMYATCSPHLFALGPKGEFHDSSKTLSSIISATIYHSLICSRGFLWDKTQWPNTKYRRHSGQIPP